MAVFAALGLSVVAACGGSTPQTFHPGGIAPSSVPQPTLPSLANAGGYSADVQFVYQSPLPSDPQQSQIELADRAFWQAFDLALYSRGKDQRYLSDIAKSSPQTITVNGATIHTSGTSYGLGYLANDVATYRSENHGIKGAVVFSATSIRPDPSSSAKWDVSSCVNDSQLLDTDSSGSMLPAAGSPNAHYYYQTDVLTQGTGGRWLVADWKLVDEYPAGEAKQCKP
jgi:hypothetical protein